MEGYSPEVIANAKAEAVKNYRDARRSHDRSVRIKDHVYDTAYLKILHGSNEKITVETAKARARLDTDVVACNVAIDEERTKMDNAFVELERIETKIQMILDSNALKRTEMKLGSILT
tara:strand:- start:71 stop:424 length:354 start_codon:yes stop_codon:yes gene_type:complete